MSDAHRRILRAAAKLHHRDAEAEGDRVNAGDPAGDAHARHVDLKRRAKRARRQLATAAARRRPPAGR